MVLNIAWVERLGFGYKTLMCTFLDVNGGDAMIS